jgi:hypothetical protein
MSPFLLLAVWLAIAKVVGEVDAGGGVGLAKAIDGQDVVIVVSDDEVRRAERDASGGITEATVTRCFCLGGRSGQDRCQQYGGDRNQAAHEWRSPGVAEGEV